MNALSSIKSAITNLSSRKNADLDDYEQPVERYVPESLEEVCRLTKYSKEEIRMIYRGFKQECPTGIVSREKFKELYAQFFPLGDARIFAGYVFDTLNSDRRGSVTFQHFIVLMSVLTRGTVEEKLQWIFNLYDLNGNGSISQTEMYTVLISVYDMLGRHTIPPIDEAAIRSHVKRLFEKLDSNNDNKITLTEFVNGCMKDPYVSRSLNGLFDTIM